MARQGYSGLTATITVTCLSAEDVPDNTAGVSAGHDQYATREREAILLDVMKGQQAELYGQLLGMVRSGLGQEYSVELTVARGSVILLAAIFALNAAKNVNDFGDAIDGIAEKFRRLVSRVVRDQPGGLGSNIQVSSQVEYTLAGRSLVQRPARTPDAVQFLRTGIMPVTMLAALNLFLALVILVYLFTRRSNG